MDRVHAFTGGSADLAPSTKTLLKDRGHYGFEEHHIATTTGYGPRFLHSTGQLHKGGPASGLFLQLTADHLQDVPIPGETYSFGVLADAQALGNLQALQASERRAARVHLGVDAEAGIRGLVEDLV